MIKAIFLFTVLLSTLVSAGWYDYDFSNNAPIYPIIIMPTPTTSVVPVITDGYGKSDIQGVYYYCNDDSFCPEGYICIGENKTNAGICFEEVIDNDTHNVEVTEEMNFSDDIDKPSTPSGSEVIFKPSHSNILEYTILFGFCCLLVLFYHIFKDNEKE